VLDRTLPASAYCSPEIYQAECEHILRREWLLVASMEQFREPGDYFCLDLVGEPIVVVLGTNRQVRALSTVCRHRYMPVVEPGRGSTDRFTCPYHAWRYGLNGALTAAPYMADVDGFSRDEHRLPSLPVEVWEGLVFVNLSPDPAPLAPRLEPVQRALSRYEIEKCRQVAFDDRMWDCNWKVAVENASECYHHVGTHKELFDPVLPARTTYGAAGGPGYAVHFTPAAAGGLGWGIPPNDVDTGLLDSDLAEMGVYTLFPNALVLNAGPFILWFSFLPYGVDRCRFLNGVLAPAALVSAGLVDEADSLGFIHEVNDQDTPIVEGVQRGVASRIAAPGVLSHREPALVNYYAYLRRMLAASGGPVY